MSAYVPLWVKSHHSFLEGASSPDELVDQAVALGLPAMVLTDRNGIYGLVRAHVRAKEAGLRLLPGVELEVREDDRVARLVLLPEARPGYERLCRLVSRAHTRGEKGQAWATLAEVAEFAEGLHVLSTDPWVLPVLREPVGDSLWALCVRHLHAEEREREAALRDVARGLELRCVGGHEVLYHHADRRSLQDVVTCVRHGKSLSEAGRLLRRNAEHGLRSPARMAEIFADAPELLRASVELAERCTLSLDSLRYRYPEESLPAGRTEQSWLRELAFEGALFRYPGGVPADVVAQLERELQVIEELEYGGYFLTMYEIVEYCRREGILCQGRGSAANSAVCFCLRITAIDPVRMDLLFERFLSRERAEPPDIDLDIEHERREEVIQHVYERYGRRRAAMVSNVVRYRARSAVREVGKALGIPRTDIDAVARLLSYHDATVEPRELASAGLDPETPAMKHLLRLTRELLDAPRHQSIHPGGFLLGHLPVDHLVPIEPATMEGRTVIQWDKYDVENLGLFKVDLLGLGALTCIRKAFSLIETHHGHRYEIATVPAEDAATYRMCSAGDTIGVFQIESRAQMAMLPRLRPEKFYDLVIEVAIVRPGPIQGDMVHPYLRRKRGDEAPTYPHPSLEKILKKTLGVPIFQEQVMKLAVQAAGYTPGEADRLRRDMAAWRSAGKIEQHKDRMIPQMIASGIEPAFAERVFDQIRGFGEYGFPESHAASFALLSYVTAWLRCHHPAVFTCALLNSQPMGFYSVATLVEDAKRHGIEVRPVDVTRSAWDHTLEAHGASSAQQGAFAIRMGLRSVRHLGERERVAFEEAQRALAFRELGDFVRRTRMNERALVSLAEAGAFESFGVDRRDALWAVRALSRANGDALPHMAAQSQLAFAALEPDDAVLWDYRASDHSARGHPVARHRPVLRSRGIPTAREVDRLPHGSQVNYVGQVICRQRPQTASGVTFFTLEDETGFVNLVLWVRVFEAHRALARTAPLLGVRGRIEEPNASGI